MTGQLIAARHATSAAPAEDVIFRASLHDEGHSRELRDNARARQPTLLSFIIIIIVIIAAEKHPPRERERERGRRKRDCCTADD